MRRFGTQYLGKSLKMWEIFHNSTENHAEIREVLKSLQDGYSERNLEKVNTFIDELFVAGKDTHVLGTGTGELYLGSDNVKELIAGDWEYWGDVNIDWQNAHISVEGNVAWFATNGSVKYTFEDAPEKYDRHVKYIKEKVQESGLTPKQKISFINWFLTLVYHQREDNMREYLWPLDLSGVILKDAGKWKIAHLQFSIPKPIFPDERFESSEEYIMSYNEQNDMVNKYKNNQMTKELKTLVKSLEKEFFGQKYISKEIVNKYFAVDNLPYVIGPENQWYCGAEEIRKFFNDNDDSTLSLDLEHAIASKSGEISWITVTGVLKQRLTEDELAQRTLEELDNLVNADLTSKEKIFGIQRNISYVLKESAIGPNYTCPIRLTAVILNQNEDPVFEHIHFSFPFYWIMEGKLDDVV
ncbi:nuclear transport factor 2 family protein [Haloimpatiens massiliensis]|uniref:nuclear transport factor 2 family protein n=1 Tax=Haloimpatiens massiliensis TaxID=1658110 RepID=UPI000C8285C3|nr:nuclear transport factor 2 family protein [Haloimpatiens massiliensis]